MKACFQVYIIHVYLSGWCRNSSSFNLYKGLVSSCAYLKEIVPYTTRPMRSGEVDGKDYYFITDDDIEEYKRVGKLIEARVYDTVMGKWTYATIDDGQIVFDKDSITIGTLEAYVKLRDYYGKENIVPIYIDLNSKLRLVRAMRREDCQENPDYKELCRRFLADEEDFSDEKLKKAGIEKRYYNKDLSKCINNIIKDLNL